LLKKKILARFLVLFKHVTNLGHYPQESLTHEN
jgi:hypothetical protein